MLRLGRPAGLILELDGPRKDLDALFKLRARASFPRQSKSENTDKPFTMLATYPWR